MTAPFECEVRVHVRDIEAFRRTLAARDARIMLAYAFSDHYYQPRHGSWNVLTQSVRIREHHHPMREPEVLLTAVEVRSANGFRFKQSRFAQGKVCLYTGSLVECTAIVEAIQFVPWRTVHKREGYIYEVPGIGRLALEDVTEVGWMVEFEVDGTALDQAVLALQEQLERLEIDPHAVIPDPVVVIAERGTGPDGRKVYFSGSIRGGRRLQPVYAQIVAFLRDHDYEVLSAHVADPDVLTADWAPCVTAAEIYSRDLRWLAACDVVVAEVSMPSLGVGVELAEAQHLGKPVICLCDDTVALSAMVGGNAYFQHIRYRDVTDLLPQLGHLLAAT